MAAKRWGIPVVSHARGFLFSRRLARRVERYVDRHIAISQAVARSVYWNMGMPECKCPVHL